MARPLRQYWHEFSHPAYPSTIKIAASGGTPCEARGEAFTLLEATKRERPELPSDNRWALVSQQMHP